MIARWGLRKLVSSSKAGNGGMTLSAARTTSGQAESLARDVRRASVRLDTSAPGVNGEPRVSSPLGVSSPTTASTLGIIRRAWADILHVDAVAADDDFFELGGNSLIVASAVALLGERIGIELPMRALFEAPTPSEMAELIDEIRAKPAPVPSDGTTPFFPTWVVPLQPEGAGRPVFVFPGGLGGKWILKKDAQVAALVGRQHPFYGFRRDRPHPGRDRDDGISAMASGYVEQIRSLQGAGPYLLYGICSGGSLAWETAGQLMASGEAIAGLLFFEAPLRLDPAGITPAITTPRSAIPGRLPPYTPQPLQVDLTLLMTEGWQARGRSDGWSRMALGSLETVVMAGDSPGAHNLYANREETIAEHVRNWIAQAEDRWRES